MGVEVDPLPSREGSLEVSRNLERGPPADVITREIQKMNLFKLYGGHISECDKVWLEGMTRCFSLREFASTSNGKPTIFHL